MNINEILRHLHDVRKLMKKVRYFLKEYKNTLNYPKYIKEVTMFSARYKKLYNIQLKDASSNIFLK